MIGFAQKGWKGGKMNRKRELREAKKHNGEAKCYIKVEDNEVFAHGDATMILQAAERIINHIAKLSGQGFVETWLFVKDLHEEQEGDSIFDVSDTTDVVRFTFERK